MILSKMSVGVLLCMDIIMTRLLFCCCWCLVFRVYVAQRLVAGFYEEKQKKKFTVGLTFQ